MAKVKTRLQYNSMGERVVVRTALDGIDAFATRSRQCSHTTNQQQQQQQQDPRQPTMDGAVADDAEATDNKLPQSTGDAGAYAQAAADALNAMGATWNPQNVGGSGWEDKGPGDDNVRFGKGDSHASRGPQAAISPRSPVPQTVSKSLGFGWPDFSAVGSKVGCGGGASVDVIFNRCRELFLDTRELFLDTRLVYAPCPPSRLTACTGYAPTNSRSLKFSSSVL